MTVCLCPACVCTRACVRVREQVRGSARVRLALSSVTVSPVTAQGRQGLQREDTITPALHAHSGWGQREQACHSPSLGRAHSSHP